MSHGEERKKERLKELGSRIRARREELGLAIEQVSEKTKIRSRYLIAVEEGDDSISPGRTYFRAFLKTYASFLGLDGSKFSAEYQEIVEQSQSGEPRKAAEVKPAPEKDVAAHPAAKTSQAAGPSSPGETSRIPAGTAAQSHKAQAARSRRRPTGAKRRRSGAGWAVIALVLLAAAVYYVLSARPSFIFGPGGQMGEEEAPATTPPSGEVQEPGLPEPAGPVDELPTEPPAPVIAREDPNAEKTIWSVDRTPLELTIKMRGSQESYCWVSVYTDGKYAFERTLVPGEIVELKAESEITIRAGKPWEMDLILNGQEIGPGGELGPVKDLVFRSNLKSE